MADHQDIRHDFSRRDESVQPHRFITQLESQNIHPVLIFGAHNSGKTLFLCSLLDHPRRAALGQMFFVQNDGYVFDNSYPLATERNKDADDFFDLVRKFGQGRVPENTYRDRPVFALASLMGSDPSQPKGSERKVTFAFMEGNGEWNEYKEEEKSPGQSTPEVRAMLREFQKPISVVFVVPCQGGVGANESGGDKESLSFAHTTAVDSMNLYENLRSKERRIGDNLLLLFTKWDQNWASARYGLPESFHKPKTEEIERRIGSAPVVPVFRNLCGTLDGSDKGVLMVYSAAILENFEPPANEKRDSRWKTSLRVDRSYARAQETIAGFNEKVWNWLYGNATEALFKQRLSLKGTAAPKSPLLGRVLEKVSGFG